MYDRPDHSTEQMKEAQPITSRVTAIENLIDACRMWNASTSTDDERRRAAFIRWALSEVETAEKVQGVERRVR